jgi:transposase
MLLGDHHPTLIRLHLEHISLWTGWPPPSRTRSRPRWTPSPASWGVSADDGPSADPGPDAAVLPAVERLAEIPGVSPKLARAIIAETGLDMTRFSTADHLVSWVGLTSVARQSGPR